MKGIHNNWSRLVCYSFIALIFLQIGIIYRWNWFCTNFDPVRHVNAICKLYKNGIAEGTLCIPLCETREITSISCQAYHTSKGAVFKAIWGDRKVIFKMADAMIPALHWFENGILKYPSENEFLATIRAVTRNMLNNSLSNDLINKLAHLNFKQNEVDSGNNIGRRRREMDNIWVLIQDNEYLLSSIFSDRNVFPQILGTCGNYFGVQYIEPIPESFSIFYEKDTKENWEKNLRYAILLMDLLEELDGNFKEPLYLCDVKLRDFGVTDLENGRAKVLDLDMVYPKSIVNGFLKNIGGCQEDLDCSFFDCRGTCNQRKMCNGLVSNNNLQIICEQIFLGWTMSHTVLLPGLLLSQYAPEELMVVLRQCANPNNENQMPRASASEEIRKRLYSILVDIEQSISTEY